MTVTTQQHRQPQLSPSVQRRKQKSNPTESNVNVVVPGLKASMVGGFGILVLMLIGLIPPPENLPFVSLAFLVIPGYLVVCLATGLLAGIFAGESLTSSQQGGKVGWLAGFWAGIFGGIVAMILAATGLLLGSFGDNVVAQFTPETLELLTGYGLTRLTLPWLDEYWLL
jgi:hypothetical protein